MTETHSQQAILDALGGVLTRWAMGGAAAASAPAAWRDALGAQPDQAELRLLALSGHFIGLCVAARPQGALRALPDVPTLALPTLPAVWRSLARRVLEEEHGNEGRAVVLDFLAGRGWTVHPADWMPGAGEAGVPEVYAPWRDWTQSAASGEVKHVRDASELSARTWDDYWPSARAAALAGLRARDPDAARALLEEKLAGEGAEARLRLLGTLAQRLSEADAPWLETLVASDRAPKVKALVASLLARLGRAGADTGSHAGDDVGELARFFELQTRGLLRRSRQLKASPPKTAAQKTRRAELLAQTDFAAFAGALDLTPGELGEVWTWGADTDADASFAAMAARSASDSIVAALARHGGIAQAHVLAPRLAPAGRAELALRLLRDGALFQQALDVGGPGCRIDRAIELPAGARWLAGLQATSQTMPADGAAQTPPPDPRELRALGLIASRAGAQEALDRLAAAGLLRADPRLDMIRLNAALDDNGAKT